MDGFVEDYIICPYCDSSNTDERMTGFGLCNECHKIFKFEEREFFKTDKLTESDRNSDQMKELTKFLKQHKFEFIDPDPDFNEAVLVSW